MVSVRTAALNAIIGTVLEKKNLAVQTDFLTKHKDISLAKSLAFGTIRHYHQLNDIVNSQFVHPIKKDDLAVHCILLLGAYQLLFSRTPSHAAIFETVNLVLIVKKHWAKPLVNAVLRKISQNKTELLDKPSYSHPTWLTKKIKHAYPEHFHQIFTQNNQQAPMVLRIHPTIDLLDYQTQLTKLGIQTQRIDGLPQALVLDQAVNVNKLPNFDQGICYVQDGSPQWAAQLLEPQPKQRILDACSAPGGKASHLAELAPTAYLTALESSQKRLVRLQENLKKHSKTPITIYQGLAQHKDWWDGVLFDKILLDVPCSATGVIRRHPDIKLLRKPKDITALVVLQAQILSNLWQTLKPGGELLYATCSILPIENDQQIQQFLSTHTNAKILPLNTPWGQQTTYGKQQLPEGCFDGFYCCKLKKLC